MQRLFQKRRGLSSTLAMLYLVLFGTLAVGFYAAVTASMQISSNETRGRKALLAAESGMAFIRHQLAGISVPPGTSPDDMWPTICQQLTDNIDDTANLNGGAITLSGNVLTIPAISLDGGDTSFTTTITHSGLQLTVRVRANAGSYEVDRGVEMTYAQAQRASAIFNYGVASKGRIVTSGQARIKGLTDPTKGSVLSTDMNDPVPVYIGGKEVSGDISITNPNASVHFDSDTTVGGTSNATTIENDHIHKGVLPPEFPTVNTDAFQAFVTNTYAGGSVLTNTRIPANSNVKFTGGATIRGVLFIEAPNNIEFRGNVDIQGVIVVANGAAMDLSKNVLNFSGNVTAKGVETLPTSYGALRNLTGSFILAPGFLVQFSGSFGTVNGSIIASQVQMTGNAGGTVVGSVINNDPTTLSLAGSSAINIVSTGTTNYPSGVYFGSHFTPLADTYRELTE